MQGWGGELKWLQTLSLYLKSWVLWFAHVCYSLIRISEHGGFQSEEELLGRLRQSVMAVVPWIMSKNNSWPHQMP